MRRKQYAAYGSNMDPTQMRYRCPDARMVGTGTAQGYRLAFAGVQGDAHATIEEDSSAETPVILWSISEADEARLDRYEGWPVYTPSA